MPKKKLLSQYIDLYQTAARLYASSLRALEQRATVFLVMQSILVGAFAILLTYFQMHLDVRSFYPTLGVATVGFVISLVFCFAHRTTSKDASYWRAYMKLLEDKDVTSKTTFLREQPWHLMYDYAKGQGTGFFSQWYALVRLPGPLLWLVLPVIFLTAWACALLWVMSLKYSSFIPLERFWLVGVISLGVAVGVSCCKWRKAKDNIYDQLRETLKESN